jgi:alcohol dehydrogenase class IV
MGVAQAEEGDQACVARLLEELSQLNADLEVPSPARFGIAKSAWDDVVDVMAEQALASGSPSNNPIVPTAAEIRALYQQAYD